jgi:hypothetical protein
MREDTGADTILAWLENCGDADSGERLHTGWGSFRNLDLMAIRRSDWGVLVDVNFHQFKVWSAVADAVAVAQSADEFVDVAVSLLPTVPRLRQFIDSTQEWLRQDFERSGSWLCSERPERFLHIQRMFLEGRIVTACMDMRGGDGRTVNSFQDLAARITLASQSRGLALDTLYVSNIPWMLAQPKGFFGEAHADHMPLQSTTVLKQVQENLCCLAPLARRVISAITLKAGATQADLQWVTEVYNGSEFCKLPWWEDPACWLPDE